MKAILVFSAVWIAISIVGWNQPERLALVRDPARANTMNEFYREAAALSGDSMLNGSETDMA
jgi:hypothetical protein